jgi:polysaccharide chain length determinant protein (PEP-CTERM system associated)
MWRRRWIAIAVMWAIALLGFAFVWSIRDVYKVATKVFVDSETVLRPLLTGLAVGTEVDTDIGMMTQILLSRPNLERVAKQTGLDAGATSEADRRQIAADLARQLFLSGGRDGTYTLSYRSTDPVMAHRVVTTLLEEFVSKATGLKQTDAEDAERFLSEQLKAYEVRLRSAEAALADFKQKNIGLMPGETGDYYSRMQTLMSNIETLQARNRQLNERRSELERQLDGEEPTFGALQSDGVSGGVYDGQIADLQRRIDQLLMQYTDKHPDILTMREQIAHLQAENERLRASGDRRALSADAGTGASRLQINPVYQSIRVSLSQTNAELAETRGQLSQQYGQLSQLRSRVNVAPEVEAQLAALNRDYEVNRAQYTTLLQRLESARISDQAQRNAEKLKFRVIEPPVVPLYPEEPNRFFLFTAVMVFAVGAGLALAFLLNLLRPIFSTRTEVQSVLGLRVLGTVSLGEGPTPPPWYLRDMAKLAACALLLFFAYVGNVAVSKLWI